MNSIYRGRWSLLAICVALFATELAFVPLPGIEGDEALFVIPFLRDSAPLYSWHLGNMQVPVMSMAYVGALKSWLYWPVFRLWPPGMWSMRLQVCVFNIFAVVLFADLVRRISDARVAVVGALLLATDAVFVLLNVYDLGPPCLQLTGLVGFLNLLQRRRFFAAFFVAGLSLWYKTSFIFPLFGIMAGFAAVYPTTVRRFLTVRNVTGGALALALGAAPLIEFNIRERGATLQAAANLPTSPVAEKVMMLRRTLDGRALEHLIFRSVSNEKLSIEGASIGETVLGWYRETNLEPGSLLLPALVLSLLALPLLRKSPLWRPLLFSWVACATTIALMFLVRDAGAGPHHTILIYPGPHFIVAATAFAISERLGLWRTPARAIVIALVAGSGVLLLGQYYRAGQRNGFSVYFTDGLAKLATAVQAQALPVRALDWGIRLTLQIETGDRVPIDEEIALQRNVLYVRHCDGYMIDRSRWERFEGLLAGSQFHLTEQRVSSDREGSPIFCLFQLE